MSSIYNPVKLQARDADDILVISATLQDAIVCLRDLAFLQEEQCLVAIFNRFMWERVRQQPWMRTLCSVRFEGVHDAKGSDIDFSDKDSLLSFLSLSVVDETHLLLAFASVKGVSPSLTLTVDTIDCRLSDCGEPWPTDQKPSHESAS